MKKNLEKLSKAEVVELLNSVAKELETDLIKVSPGLESPGEDEADVSATSPAKPSEGANKDAPPGADGPEASADSGAESDKTNSDAKDDADGNELEALEHEISKLSVEELEHLMSACRNVLMSKLSDHSVAEDAHESLTAQDVSPLHSNSVPVAPGPEVSPAQKSELEVKLESLTKKLEAAEEENRIVKSQLSEVVTALDKFINTPMRKAVNAHGFMPIVKSEKTLTKAEIDEKLIALSKSEKTSTADRELINSFYFGNVSIDKLSHLLK